MNDHLVPAMPEPAPPKRSLPVWVWIVGGLIVSGVCAVVVVVVAGLLFLIPARSVTLGNSQGSLPSSTEVTAQTTPLASSPSSPKLVERTIPIQGNAHIAPGSPHAAYNSNPPTSGPHYADRTPPVPADFYDESNAPLDERLVHAEEHGYVILWYNCTKAPNGDCDALKAALRQLRDNLGGTKLIVTPRTHMDTLLAMTSWGKLQLFDAFDVDKLSAFYHRNVFKAPEPDGP
jgi:hypothetical protein